MIYTTLNFTVSPSIELYDQNDKCIAKLCDKRNDREQYYQTEIITLDENTFLCGFSTSNNKNC